MPPFEVFTFAHRSITRSLTTRVRCIQVSDVTGMQQAQKTCQDVGKEVAIVVVHRCYRLSAIGLFSRMIDGEQTDFKVDNHDASPFLFHPRRPHTERSTPSATSRSRSLILMSSTRPLNSWSFVATRWSRRKVRQPSFARTAYTNAFQAARLSLFIYMDPIGLVYRWFSLQ